MKSLILFLLLIIFGKSTLFSQDIGLPKINDNDQIIHHTGYTLNYVEKYEQASWVAYTLSREKTHKAYERSNKFLVDPLVKTESADDIDYKRSGFDRGHLAAASDLSYTLETMQESFYYSNMSPQVAGFNRGIWKNLESLVRSWAVEYDSVYVVTGAVLEPNLPTIGHNGVAVPRYYYKVILEYSKEGTKGIGFVLPNESSSESLQSFVISIDSVERLTGIDFYPALPDNIENKVESNVCLSCWTWYVVNKSSESSNTTHQNIVNQQTKTEETQNTTSVQCLGTTQKGNRCKRMTKSPNGKCYQHGGN